MDATYNTQRGTDQAEQNQEFSVWKNNKYLDCYEIWEKVKRINFLEKGEEGVDWEVESKENEN